VCVIVAIYHSRPGKQLCSDPSWILGSVQIARRKKFVSFLTTINFFRRLTDGLFICNTALCFLYNVNVFSCRFLVTLVDPVDRCRSKKAQSEIEWRYFLAMRVLQEAGFIRFRYCNSIKKFLSYYMKTRRTKILYGILFWNSNKLICTRTPTSDNSQDSNLIFMRICNIYDRLCGLVVRVLGYRSGGPGSIPSTIRKKNIVGLERGALSLVSTNWGATW
jgi:hypothetical protein